MNRAAGKIWRGKVNVRFSHELPGGDMLDVVAIAEPGKSNRPGDPEEEIQIEILECFLIDASGAQPNGLVISTAMPPVNPSAIFETHRPAPVPARPIGSRHWRYR